VLPFANMSGDPEQEYFSDGITEDIITDLGKVSALSIVSRNLAFSFKGATGGVGDIGRQTKASHVLVGSVRKAGERVRITAQLIDALERFAGLGRALRPRPQGHLRAAGRNLQGHRGGAQADAAARGKDALEQRSTSNAQAYKLYLMARQFWLLDNERNNEIVIRICKHVVELDPDYAQAWATLALAQWNLFWQSDLADSDMEYPARRALELGPHLADSHAAIAAAASQPGRLREGLEAATRALELEPKSYVANRMAGLCCMGLRDYDDGDSLFRGRGRRDGHGLHGGDLHRPVLPGQGRQGALPGRCGERPGADREDRLGGARAQPGDRAGGLCAGRARGTGSCRRLGHAGAPDRSGQRKPPLQPGLRHVRARRGRSRA
jgi:adenylate cyclase